MNPSKQAYSYIRFSSPQQEWGDSERRQEQLATDYCAKNGLTLSEKAFRDRGISAWKGKNRVNALGELLQVLKPGNTLLIEDNDRLSREDPLTAMNLLHSIVAKGVTVVTLRDGSKISKTNFFDLSTFLPNIVKGALANQENEKKSLRIKESWKGKRADMLKGIHRSGKLPFWLKKSHDKLVLIPDKAEIVRKIFDLSLNGRGINAILHYLIENKIPPSGHRDIWINSTVQRILKSPTVYGVFQPKTLERGRKVPIGEPIENYYPPVISKETFLVARRKIEKRQNSFKGHCNPERVTNLVSGLAKCSKCGSSMVVTDKARKKYLYCNQRINNVNCVAGGILYPVFEIVLLECLGEGLATSGFFENKSDLKKLQFKIDAKDQELIEGEQRINKIANLVVDSDAPQVLVQKLKEMEIRQAAGKSEMEGLQAALIAAKRLPDEYRLLVMAIEKSLKQALPAIKKSLKKHFRGEVTIDLNAEGIKRYLASQTSPTLPTDRFVLREGLRSMVKKMIVDIPTLTTTTTWINDKVTKFAIKRENHGNKGNVWYYRAANHDEPLSDWKKLDVFNLPSLRPREQEVRT